MWPWCMVMAALSLAGAEVYESCSTISAAQQMALEMSCGSFGMLPGMLKTVSCGSLQVTSIVACMLETGSDAIVEHLFGDCDLLGWLLNAPAQFEPERRAGDER